MLAAVALCAVAVAGCTAEDGGQPAATPTPAASGFLIQCHLVDAGGAPLRGGNCTFSAAAAHVHDVDEDGFAGHRFPPGSAVTVLGRVPGYQDKQAEVVADAPKTVTLVLVPTPDASPTPAPGEPTPGPGEPGGSGDPGDPGGQPTITPRAWLPPVDVTGAGNEPHVVVAADGTIYYSPLNTIWRSIDGGMTFEDISPAITEALPPLATDTSVSVAPDGSVWFSRTWGYAGTTIGCTSADRGASWTCDNLAIPPLSDRMWIVGLDAARGYLQTNLGLYHHVWFSTDVGSAKYIPYATTTQLLAVRNGNMVYDATRDTVWQVEWVGGTIRLYDVTAGPGLISAQNTGVPAPYALPWLSMHDGVMWVTGEPEEEGTRTLLAARSVDGGASWATFPIQSAAASITFSFAAAGPDGRVAIVYYGSDAAGPSTANGGTWSLYVAETDDGLSEHPTWVETMLVEGIHEGNVCIGLNCEDSGGDPEARFSGDLIGAWIDGDGNTHVAYNDDTNGGALNKYIRQVLG